MGCRLAGLVQVPLMFSHVSGSWVAQSVERMLSPCIQPPDSWHCRHMSPLHPEFLVSCDQIRALRMLGWHHHWAASPAPQPLMINGKLFPIQASSGLLPLAYTPNMVSMVSQCLQLSPSALRSFSSFEDTTLSGCGLFLKELQTSCSLLYNYVIQLKKKDLNFSITSQWSSWVTLIGLNVLTQQVSHVTSVWKKVTVIGTRS